MKCKPYDTPMSIEQKLSKIDGESFSDPTFFRSIVGALQYLTLTRPELAYSVNKLSQFMSNPSTKHWAACNRVLRYLQTVKEYGLEFMSGGSISITGYSDAD